MTFLEELQHVSPKVDAEGYEIAWMNLADAKVHALTLLSRMPESQKESWRYLEGPGKSDSVRLDEDFVRQEPYNDQTACFVRFDSDGSVHTLIVMRRETSDKAFLVLAFGGMRSNGTMRRCLFDVGVLGYRSQLHGTPEMVDRQQKQRQFDQKEVRPWTTYAWTHTQEQQ